eukprot:Skav200227  [mRNA]  locus=scaffold2352:115543:120910:+ [translate_table: standard]
MPLAASIWGFKTKASVPGLDGHCSISNTTWAKAQRKKGNIWEHVTERKDAKGCIRHTTLQICLHLERVTAKGYFRSLDRAHRVTAIVCLQSDLHVLHGPHPRAHSLRASKSKTYQEFSRPNFWRGTDSMPAPEARPPCKFGAECYRKNPDHKRQFSHPGDPDHPDTPAEEQLAEAEAEAFPEEEGTFGCGDVVELHGLEKVPELNGRTGRLLEWRSDVDRWSCQLQQEIREGKEVKEAKVMVRPCNIKAVGGIADTPSTPFRSASERPRAGLGLSHRRLCTSLHPFQFVV